MTPTDLQLVQGDATTIPEETAFAAYQTLREARTNPELAANPALATSREALKSYVTERRRHGHDLFPNVTTAANRERNDSLAGLYTKPLEKALPQQAFSDLTRKMEFVPDPETFKMREINRTFLSATVGQAIPPEKYDTIRTIYAKQHLGLDKDTSEAAVFTAIKTRFNEELSSTEKIREIAKGEFEFILGGTLPNTLPDLSAIPERLRPQVSDQILATRRQSKERIRQAMPAVREIMPALQAEAARLASGEMQGLPHLALMDRMAAALPRDPLKKEIAIALIAREMQKLPEQEKGAFARILTSIERGTDNAALAAIRAPMEAGAAIRDMIPAGAEQKRTAADNLTIRTDAENLRKAFLGEVDPLRRAGDNLAIQSLVLAGESAWTIPATLAGPIGWGAMASSFSGNSFQDARTINPDASAGAQIGAAAISGPLQAAEEVILTKIGFKIIGGKLPGLAGILNKSGVFNPFARAAIAGTTGAVSIGTVEYAEEAVQGGTDRLAQDLALEFSNIAPDTDWKGFWGDWLTVGKAEQKDTLLAVLPFAVVGAGGASFQHFRYGSQLAKNRTVLDAIGVPSSVVDEMVNTTDVKKTDELFRQAWETGLEERTQEQKAAALDVMREINSLTAAAGLDRITRDSEFTYTYTDPLTRQSEEFETEEEALLHWRQQALSASQTDLDTIALTSREDLLNFLTSEGKASEETMIDEQERTLTLPQAVKEGIASQAQIDSRVRIFILQNGLTPAQAAKEVAALTIRARSYTQQSRDGQYRYAVQLFKNADPLDVFEDFAEDSIKRAFDDSLADPRRILRDIRAYEEASNTRLIAQDYEYDPDNTLPLVEGFSALARALVIGNARADLLPPAVSQWIEVAATYGANTIDLARSAITADLTRAGDLKKALSAGQVPTELVSRLEDAIGINETEVLARLEKKHRDQLAAEAMGGFPEIRENLEGRMPHPETLRKNQHPLAGEVRRIWESMKKPTRRKDRSGRTIDRSNEANAFFLPVGQMVDIDKLREAMNEKGFDFDTPADMLDALESSISYNKPVYGTGSRGNDTFSVSSFQGQDTTTKTSFALGSAILAHNAALRIPRATLMERIKDEFYKPDTDPIAYNPDHYYRYIDENGWKDAQTEGHFRPNPTKGDYSDLYASKGTTAARYKARYVVEIDPAKTGQWGTVGSEGYVKGEIGTILLDGAVRVFRFNQSGTVEIVHDNIGGDAFLSPTGSRGNDSFSLGTTYPRFNLRPDGPTLYVHSNTGVLFPDGHEIKTLPAVPDTLSDGRGAFWDGIRNGGRRDAILRAWRKKGTDQRNADWLVKALSKADGWKNSGTVAETWQWLANSLNSMTIDQGWEVENIIETLPELLDLPGAVWEGIREKDYAYIPISPDGTVLYTPVREQKFAFGRLPTTAEVAEAQAAHDANPQIYPSFSIGRATVTPTDSTRTFQGQDGQTVIGPASFSIAPDYGINHRPTEDGPRAHDLAEGDMMPADVYDHPEWYSGMGKKIIAETMKQLRAAKGKADAILTIYRAGPVGEMNPGDWVSLSKEYARTHADAQDPEGFKVWESKVKAQDVRWAMDDLAEFGYFGEKSEATESNVSFSIGAYHGTPHKVDKFTTAKIGTGEGAQAYGWGLYFADSVAVAADYRDALSNIDGTHRDTLKVGKKAISEVMAEGYTGRQIVDIAAERLMAKANTLDAYPAQALPYKDAAKNIRAIYKSKGGNLYTVTLKVEEDQLLDYDRPLSQQRETVRAALLPLLENIRAEFPTVFPAGFDLETLTGTGYLSTLNRVDADRLSDDRIASERMLAAGIRGIRYLDGNSRNSFTGWKINPPKSNEGMWIIKSSDPNAIFFEAETEAEAVKTLKSLEPQSYNYVIFNEADIEILEENGQPVSLSPAPSLSPSSFSIGTRRVMPTNYPESAREIVSTTNVKGITHALLKPGEQLVILDEEAEKPMMVSPAYKAAKRGGDKRAAWDIARLFLTGKRVARYKAAIGDSSPVFVPVRQEEGAKQNLLPIAAAWALQKQLGGRVADTVLQLKKGGLTGADNNERSKKDHDFEGALEIQPGETVVLIDDTFTSGSTLTSLYDHLSAQGIQAEHIFSIASGRYTKNIAATTEQITRALDKVGMSEEEFQRATGIPIQAFTGAELAAYSLNGARGIEGFALRFDVGGNTGSGSMVPGADAGLAPSFSIGGMKAANWTNYQSQGRAFTGADGKPRFEMDASKATLNANAIKDPAHRNGYKRLGENSPVSWFVPDGMDTPLGNILDFDELYENYPELAGLKVNLHHGDPSTRGSFARTEINGKVSLGFSTIYLSGELKAGQILSTLLHEVQHAIQAVEGFPRGSSPKAETKRYNTLRARRNGIQTSGEMREYERKTDEVFQRFNRDEITAEEMYATIESLGKSDPAYQELLSVEKELQSITQYGIGNFDAFRAYKKNPGEKEARGVQARQSMTDEERAASPFMASYESYSLGPAAFARLEQAIAAKMTAAPDERAEYYTRVRDRLAATQQRLEDMDNGIGVFARLPTDEAGEERRRIQDAIAEARAIIGALPPEARGRVEMDFEDITSKTTEKGRVKALIRLMDKADIALEKVLQSAYLESITRVLDLAQPDLRQNRSVRGRLTPETQRLINAILPLTRLTPIEASAEQIAAQASFDALDNQFPDPDDDAAVDAWERSLAAAQERLDLIDTFASLSTQTSAELAAARKHLLQIYTKGRTARQMLDQAKRSEVASQRREVIESLGGLPSQSKWKKRVDDKGFLDRMEGYRLGLVSFHEMMEWMFPNSIAARDYQKRIRDAERSVSRARIDARQRWENFAFTALNLTGRSRKRRLNRIIADLSTARDDWNIEIAEGRRSESVKMSEEQAASILDGTLKPGWEKDLIAMESLRQALADFRLKRKAAQDQDKAFQGKVIRFERVTQRGAPTFLRMSDMEAVYYLQLAAQSQYLPALDKYGFTEKVLNQIQAKIDPRATAIMSHLRGEYDMQYQRLNPVHQRLFGLDMPQIRNYAPGAFESMDGKQDPNISPDGTGGALSAMSAGFTKARTHHMARPRQANALALYWSSLEQTEHFIAWAEVMRDMRQIFRSPDVRRTLEATYGSLAGAEFSTWLDVLETDGRSRAAESLALTQTVNRILTAQSAIGLSFNIGTIFKQWSAGIGHFMLMPTGAAIKATYKALSSPKTLRDVWNSEAIQQRILQGISPEDRRLMDAANASPSLAMELLEMGRLPISLADGAFTTLMGAAAYRYQYDEATKNGLPDSQAHTAALAHMDMVITRAAQPATTQDKSLAENTARGIGKTLFLFKSDPRQKFAFAITAIRLATRGDLKTPEAIRRVFFSWSIYGLMAQVAADMWRAISRDDDDAELWEPKDYIAAMIAGPLAGVPILGAAMESTIRSLVGARAFQNNINPIDKAASMLFGSDLATIRAMEQEDVDLNEILIAATRDAANISQLLAIITPAPAIIPAGLRAVRDVVGIGSNVLGAFSGDTPEDIAARIVREEKEADRKPAENRKQTLDTLAKELAAMPAAQREKRLRQLDADTRTAITSRLRKADMTPSERSLASLPAAARAKAIARILAELPEEDRKPYLDRLESIGLIPD